MKPILAGMVITSLMALTAKADDVPFATPKFDRSASEEAIGTLANIMTTIQLRHEKLWNAGRSKNWNLLNYEAKKLADDFVVAAGFYRNLPIDNILLVERPLNHLMGAAKTKDSALFLKAFDEFTAGCNSCHAAGQVGFVKIRVPTSPSFTNQHF